MRPDTTRRRWCMGFGSLIATSFCMAAAGCGGQSVNLNVTAPVDGSEVNVGRIRVFGTVKPSTSVVEVAGGRAQVAHGEFARWIVVPAGLSHVEVVATAGGYAPKALTIAVRSSPNAQPTKAADGTSGSDTETIPPAPSASVTTPPPARPKAGTADHASPKARVTKSARVSPKTRTAAARSPRRTPAPSPTVGPTGQAPAPTVASALRKEAPAPTVRHRPKLTVSQVRTAENGELAIFGVCEAESENNDAKVRAKLGAAARGYRSLVDALHKDPDTRYPDYTGGSHSITMRELASQVTTGALLGGGACEAFREKMQKALNALPSGRAD